MILSNELPKHYSLLPFLPLFSSIIFIIISIHIGRNKPNIASCLIFGITFIRYCLHPYIMSCGNFNAVMKYNIADNAENGILLMMYECLAIYVAMIIASKKYRISATNIPYVLYSKKSWLVILMLIGYLCFSLILRPDLTNLFMSIFQIGESEFTRAGRLEEQTVGSLMRVISTLFSFVFMIVRILLPVYIIGYFMKKKTKNNLLILIVLLWVFLEFMFVTATFAESIISSLVIILSIGKSNKSLQRKMMKISLIFVVGIIVFYFYSRFQVTNTRGNVSSAYAGNSIMENMASLINAYFTGIDNVAASFNLPRENRIEYFLASMQVTIPFNTTLFGKAGETLPVLFNKMNLQIGQISSTVGNGYFYLGPLFSPIFSFTFSYLAIKFNSLALNASLYWHYVVYMLAAILFSLGLGMYNEVITIQYFFNWVVPLLIVVRYLNK